MFFNRSFSHDKHGHINTNNNSIMEYVNIISFLSCCFNVLFFIIEFVLIFGLRFVSVVPKLKLIYVAIFLVKFAVCRGKFSSSKFVFNLVAFWGVGVKHSLDVLCEFFIKEDMYEFLFF